jgi:para-nitrobenzyl esterase
MLHGSSRRTFVKRAALLLASAQARPLIRLAAADSAEVTVATSFGTVRGMAAGGVNVFKGIPYGGTTAGENRFRPPSRPVAWSGTRDALLYGPTAPQTTGTGAARGGGLTESEDCLVLNVFTPALGSGRRPVMVWLHGGGFSTGSGSGAILDGRNLARTGDVVVVTINHRLNVFGFAFLGDVAGPEFASSGAAGMLDIVAALEWVRDNIDRFGGNPNLVTIFGQSGGGRKVATLMSMPSAKGLFQRAIIESGAVLRLTTREDATHATDLLLAELGLSRAQARDLQRVPMAQLLAANAAVNARLTLREPGQTANSPTIDGKVLPIHPFDPAAPAISVEIPLLVGYVRTEETFYDRPTPDKLALDEVGLTQHVAQRLGVDPARVIDAFRQAHPDATPWDLWILIATDHPRGAYSRELARRKAAQAAPVYVYRFDWETPEGGGHMRSPHTVEIPFVFHNIDIAGPLISKMPEAHALADKVSSAWVAFARSGDPNVPGLPKWAGYSAASRDTMLFNNVSRVAQDPDRVARLAMEQVLKLA